MVRARKIASRLSNAVIHTPMIIRHGVYSALNIWPHAKRLSPPWQDIPIYCISMKASIHRRAIVSQQIETLGVRSFTFIDAPDLTAASLADLEAQGLYDNDEAIRYHSGPLRPAQISCSLAHGMAYDQMLADGHPSAMIIEDDALFMSKNFESVDLGDLPSDFDIVFLNSFRYTKQPTDRISGCIFGTESYKGSTAAYVLSDVGARKLAAAYKPVIHAADGLVGRCMEWPEDLEHPFKRKGARTTLRSYLVSPDLVLNGSDCYYYNSIHRVRSLSA